MENLQIMAILFAIVILGYAANKLGYIGGEFDKKLSRFVIDITSPLLILSSAMGEELPDRTLILPLLAIGFLTYIILLVYGFLVPKLLTPNHDHRGMIGFALMFGNVGFIGYPVAASIFGTKAIFYTALLNTSNTFFIFTAGVMLVKGQYSLRSFNPRILLSPSLLAAFIATILVILQVHTPTIISRPITMVGNITIPAALLSIGSSMASLSLRDIIGTPKVYIATILRLAIIPLSVYYLFRACGVPTIVNEINTIIIAMPVAAYGTMFCLKYNRDPKLMIEITFFTTILSVATIPLLTLLFKN